MITAAQLREFVSALCAEEEYEPVEGRRVFHSGGSCCCCTDSAMKVANAFGGRVVGYYSSNNKSASIGGDRCEGHDFAIIGDRFIVDYWAFRIAGLADRPVFDLNKLEEREKAELLFGREDNWRDVFVWSGGGPGNVTV